MPSIELLTAIAAALGVPLAVLLLSVALLAYPQTRLLLGDLLKWLAFAGRWVRRSAIAAEVEGSLNSFVNKYNQEAASAILPQCKVEWVNAENHAVTISPGSVIVRVSLGRDHDKNFFAATTTFVAHSFLPRTKVFLEKATARSLDLIMVNGILRAGRRALEVFNEQFVNEPEPVREKYYKLEDVEQEGLLKRILFRELDQLGASLGDRVPRSEHADEVERFLAWLHGLATRERGDATKLSFDGRWLRVGVILVAREETFLLYGIDPYLQRAISYAAQGFESIYLLSRGARRGDLVKRIARDLENLGGFESLAKQWDIRVGNPQSNEVVTCVPLRVDAVALIQTAWERIVTAKANGKPVQGTVLLVGPTRVDVEVYGLEASLVPDSICGIPGADPTKYFRAGDELVLDVVEAEPGRNHLVLSNIGTETDPRRVVDAFAAAKDQVVFAMITRHMIRDEVEIGCQVALEGTPTPGFLPRTRARRSRFKSLVDELPVGNHLAVKVLSFQSARNKWLCEAADRPDPWTTLQSYAVGETYDVTIREVAERYTVCELIDGVEGRVTKHDVAWGSDADVHQAMQELQPGQVRPAVLLTLDPEHRTARFSFRQVVTSATRQYFDEVKNRVFNATVQTVHEQHAELTATEGQHRVVLRIRDAVWGYCTSLDWLLKVGDTIGLVALAYDTRSDSIFGSIKLAWRNDYRIVVTRLTQGLSVVGEVVAVGPDQAYISASVDDKTVAGYVHKSQVSNIAFVGAEELGQLMPKGSKWTLVVKRTDDRHQVVEFSRRGWLLRSFLNVEYGKTYSGAIQTLPSGRCLFVSDELEAYVGRFREGRPGTGSTAEVIIARKGGSPRDLEIGFATEKGATRTRKRR